MSFVGDIFGAFGARKIGKFNQGLLNKQSELTIKNAEIKKQVFTSIYKNKKTTRNLERPLSSLLYFASSLLKKLITSFSPCMYIAENAYAVYVHDHIRVYIYVHNHIRGYTHTYMHVHRQNRVCCICT